MKKEAAIHSYLNLLVLELKSRTQTHTTSLALNLAYPFCDRIRHLRPTAFLAQSNQTRVEFRNTPNPGRLNLHLKNIQSHHCYQHPRQTPTLAECLCQYWRLALRSPRISEKYLDNKKISYNYITKQYLSVE